MQAKPDDSDALYRSGLPGVLLYGAALDPGLAQRIKALSPLTVIAMRYVGGNDDFIQDGSVSPKQRAREFADQALPLFERVRPYADNLVMGWNELQIGDLREIPVAVLEERARRHAEGEWELNRIWKANGYRTIGFNFSRGTPHVLAFDRWSPFHIYAPVMADASMDFFGYHAYWDAADAAAGSAQILSHNATTFRYRAIYDELPAAARKPVIFTEFGEDGPGGYKRFSTISGYIEKMKAVEAIWDAAPHPADRYVYLALMFLAGRSDERWATFDPMDNESDRAAFMAFANRGGSLPAVPNPAPIPPTGETPMLTAEERKALAWKQLAVPYNPDATFAKVAREKTLGMPESTEWRETVNGTTYAGQNYAGGFVMCVDGLWASAKAYSYDTGEELTAAPPPVVTPPPTGGILPYLFPPVLTNVGANGEEGQPTAGQPFYRLTGATVRQGVSAFLVVTVLGKSAPAIGAKVVNLFPDGNGEVIQTDGSGVARFQFAASSAFTEPGTGPFTIFVGDESAAKDFEAKRVTFKLKLSDVVHSLGDFRGEHTEIYLQFVEQDV